MRLGRSLLLVVGLALAAGRTAHGQNADDLLQQGIRAYRRAEFDAATVLLRRALDFAITDSAALGARARSLDYLAAAELYRGRRDSAAAVFRRIIQREPRHRLDELVFPPEVSNLLEEIRRSMKTVMVEAAADTTIRLAAGQWNVRLLASSYHMVTALVLSQAGTLVREIYLGPIGDTLSVQWDGRDSLNQPVSAGNYVLSIASTVGEQTVRLLKLPLAVEVLARDTLPLPVFSDSLLLPEQIVGRRSGSSLIVSLALGAAAAVLPVLVAKGADPSPTRFALSGAVGIAGIAGFIGHRSSRPLPANIARNRARREAWQAQMQATVAGNARGRGETQVRIRLGTPTSVGSGVP